jgi:hypothetical protein
MLFHDLVYTSKRLLFFAFTEVYSVVKWLHYIPSFQSYTILLWKGCNVFVLGVALETTPFTHRASYGL